MEILVYRGTVYETCALVPDRDGGGRHYSDIHCRSGRDSLNALSCSRKLTPLEGYRLQQPVIRRPLLAAAQAFSQASHRRSFITSLDATRSSSRVDRRKIVRRQHDHCPSIRQDNLNCHANPGMCNAHSFKQQLEHWRQSAWY